ncbi:MAG: hypothetical protein JSS66_00210 [Armatimonadetes bacterium]|nr:hypothetical protein [Armatimonadota bacterium]
MILADVQTSNYWSATNPTSGGIINTTPVTYATPGISSRAYLASINVWNTSGSGSTVVQAACSGTVLWQGELTTSCPGISMNFEIPLRGIVGGPITVQCLTTGQKVWATLSGFFDSQ